MLTEKTDDRFEWQRIIRKARRMRPNQWADFVFYVGNDGTLKERIDRARDFESMRFMEERAAAVEVHHHHIDSKRAAEQVAHILERNRR